MDRMIVIEVLGRGAAVAHRARLVGPVSVGRAYDNDVIVDDPFVDPHAISVEAGEDGSIVVRDLGTRNGVHAMDGTRIGDMVTVRAGEVVRVGRTRLRLIRGDTPVAPALHSGGSRLGELTARRGALPIALAAFMTLWTITSYNNEIENFTAALILTELFGILILLSIWAGVWALGTRLAGGRARFGEHATVALVGLIVALPLSIVVSVLGFLWPGETTDALGIAYGLAVATGILYAHLGIASRLGGRNRGWIAASVVLALVGLGYLIQTADPTLEAPVQRALGELVPMPADLIPAVDLDAFLDQATADLAADLADEEGS